MDGQPDRVAWVVCALAAAFGLWALHVGWHRSIFDMHGFRQSQTAWTVYWMASGGPFLRYQTPIFGPPWTAPFECPLFQWIVASAMRLAGTALEPTGRAVSVGFFLATLVPLWFALDIVNIAPRHRPIVLALFVASPLYIFWSRTLMIESTALFFSVTYIAAIQQALKADWGARQFVWILVAALAGSAAGAVKATTLLPFALAGALLIGARWLRVPPPAAAAAGFVLLGIAAPAAATITWTDFADRVKAESPLSAGLVSTAPDTRLHNYGTWRQRFTFQLWNAVVARPIRGATPHTVVGNAALFVFAIVSTAWHRNRLTLSAVLLALYLLPIMVFAQLYFAHVYYTYATGIFLLVIVGSGIVTWLERADGWRWVGTVSFGATVAAMMANYLSGYYRTQSEDHDRPLALGHVLREATMPSDVLLLYGMEYSSEVPYAAKRRAIMDWQNLGIGHPTIDRTIASLGRAGIGAMVACDDTRSLPIIRNNSTRLGLSLTPSRTVGTCDVYTPGAIDANGGSQSAAATESLRQKAVHILRTTMETEQRWIKVHAADALLALDYPQGVAQAFGTELAARGGEPEYRVGIWRVLAQASRDDREREQWISKIRAAFLDTRGPDRLHAAETLAKLGYHASGREADAFDLVARTGDGPLAANARWVLANSGRADGDTRLAELLDSDDAGTRADAAYAIRYLPKLSPTAWGKLTGSVLKTPADDGARVFLISAAFVHAPWDQKARFKTELLKYAQTGTNAQRFEACAALAKAGQGEDLPLLGGLLDNLDPDVRVGAAHAILWILKG